MRTACLLLAFSLGAAGQPIQETEAARARHMLESPQWLDKAWGAYFAGRLHSAELQEPLIEAIREAAPLRNATSVTEEYGYMAALFDAAIESGISVPPEVLEPFEDNWRAPVIILLARDPASEESLLRLREKDLRDSEWLAVNNLLMALKSQRFFVRTLSEVKISHVFTLTDPGDPSSTGGGGGGGECGDGVLVMPKGFPPVGLYELLDSPQRGDVMLAPGPRDAYFRRSVAATGKQVGFGSCGLVVDRQKLTAEYLAALGAMTEGEIVYMFHQQTMIEFQNEANLRERWEGALSAQEAAIRAFVRAAQDHGLGSVTGMKLQIVPQVYDLRKTTAGPPPSLTPHEFVLN